MVRLPRRKQPSSRNQVPNKSLKPWAYLKSSPWKGRGRLVQSGICTCTLHATARAPFFRLKGRSWPLEALFFHSMPRLVPEIRGHGLGSREPVLSPPPKSLRILIPTSSGDNIFIKNRAKTLEVSKKGSRFQDLKRFSCVFNGNVVPTNSGDTISESVLNTFFSKIPIAAWEIVISMTLWGLPAYLPLSRQRLLSACSDIHGFSLLSEKWRQVGDTI